MDLEDLLDRSAVAIRPASSKAQALSAIADLAAPRVGQPAGDVLKALVARERVGSTGVGGGVALPHARLRGLTGLHGVLLKLEQPIAFDAADDRAVDLLFGLFAPDDAGAEHLQALARVSRALRDSDLRRQLRSARSADAMFAMLMRDTHASAA